MPATVHRKGMQRIGPQNVFTTVPREPCRFRGGYRRGALDGVATARDPGADGWTEADREGIGVTGATVGLDGSAALGSLVGPALGPAVGGAERDDWPGPALDGAGVAVRGGGFEGLLAGGGARGTVGEPGASEAVRRSGSTTRAATPQVRAAPAAARSILRRDAPRRIAS
ncbi:hypothetical protein [Streptomyces sp. NBC_01530]|uniref:hypothetical protein n=1 Tax=Streptomyces sp. NBC_01530 TaxID=2903895 RepID=UPI00386B4388